jgi:hypothetical protein
MKMAVFWVVAPRGLVRMQAAQISETSINSYQSTRRYNPEDGHLQLFISWNMFRSMQAAFRVSNTLVISYSLLPCITHLHAAF